MAFYLYRRNKCSNSAKTIAGAVFFAIEKESVHEIVWARKTWELSATASQIWAGMATIFTSGRKVTQTK